nr:MAG TPA: hypothetical protein [Caudoviricetes sp.]
MPLFSMDYLLKYSAIHGKYKNPAITTRFKPIAIVQAIAFNTGLFSIVVIMFFIISFLMLELNI